MTVTFTFIIIIIITIIKITITVSCLLVICFCAVCVHRDTNELHLFIVSMGKQLVGSPVCPCFPHITNSSRAGTCPSRRHHAPWHVRRCCNPTRDTHMPVSSYKGCPVLGSYSFKEKTDLSNHRGYFTYRQLWYSEFLILLVVYLYVYFVCIPEQTAAFAFVAKMESVYCAVRTYSLTYSMEQSPSWEANWFCS